MYSRAVLKSYIFMKYYMLSKNLLFKSNKIQSKYMNVKVFNTHLKNKVDYQMLLYIFLFTQIDGKISQKLFFRLKKVSDPNTCLCISRQTRPLMRLFLKR